MDWLTENWFWILIFAGFIVMHMFGHGGHGGHGSHGPGNHDDNSMNRSDKNEDSGHQHH